MGIAPVDLTVLMPCLNEAETLAACIEKAKRGTASLGLTSEILIADNGSTDGSPDIAERLGARVVHVHRPGYGSAIAGGIAAAQGRWVVVGDADDSYDFSRLQPFVDKLQQGSDLVMGCRMPRGGGRIESGAMPWKHRWIGNPVLSLIGRVFFGSPIQDFHCGLRAIRKDACDSLKLQTTGMEFASEMVIKATLNGLRIAEVPIVLHKDGRSRPPHLRSWRDGWRHLRFMLLFSPRWLFLVPGLALLAAGTLGMLLLVRSPLRVGAMVLDAGTMAVASAAALVGFQLVVFAVFTKIFAIAEGLMPDRPSFARWFRIFTLERGIVAAAFIGGAGAFLLVRSVLAWRAADFGPLSASENLRQIIPAVTLLAVGVQLAFSSFFMSVLGLRTATRTPPGETLETRDTRPR